MPRFMTVFSTIDNARARKASARQLLVLSFRSEAAVLVCPWSRPFYKTL